MQLDEQAIEQKDYNCFFKISLHTYIFDQINFTKLAFDLIISIVVFSLIIMSLESMLSLVARKTKTIA